jgi:hypothetical protein
LTRPPSVPSNEQQEVLLDLKQYPRCGNPAIHAKTLQEIANHLDVVKIAEPQRVAIVEHLPLD